MKRKILRWLKKYGAISLVLVLITEFLIYKYCETLSYITCGILLGILLLGLIDWGLSRTSCIKKLRNPVVYPNNDWYRKNYERNYDSIILGNTTLTEPVKNICLEYIGSKSFDLTLKKQSLVWDFIVLQNNFSILKEGGCAIFQLSMENIKSFAELPKHKSRYYKGMSTYLFSKNELEYWLVKFSQVSSLLFLAFYLMELFKPKCKADYKSFTDFIYEVISFCQIRRIKPVFLIDKCESEISFLTYTSEYYKLLEI